MAQNKACLGPLVSRKTSSKASEGFRCLKNARKIVASATCFDDTKKVKWSAEFLTTQGFFVGLMLTAVLIRALFYCGYYLIDSLIWTWNHVLEKSPLCTTTIKSAIVQRPEPIRRKVSAHFFELTTWGYGDSSCCSGSCSGMERVVYCSLHVFVFLREPVHAMTQDAAIS